MKITESAAAPASYYSVWSASDESLLAGMASGDPAASAAFVRRYQARVFGLAMTIVDTPAIAEEVAQEAFVRAWKHAAAYDPRRGRVATWLLAITRNAAIDAVRVRRDRPIDPADAVILLDRDGAPPGPGFEDAEELREALAALPEVQRRPIVLAVYYGLPLAEIAQIENVPVGTAKTRLRRGLIRLRAGLGVSDE